MNTSRNLHYAIRQLTRIQAFRQASRPARPLTSTFSAPSIARLTPFQIRLLSQETRQAIDKAVGSAPVVLFMKGTPETPQCGFSRASIQILGLQGVDPSKFTAFNVLEDEELRQGKAHEKSSMPARARRPTDDDHRQVSRNTLSGQQSLNYMWTRSLLEVVTF